MNGYYDMCKIINNFRLLTWSSFIGQFVTEGRVCGRRFGWGMVIRYFSPLWVSLK